MATDTQRMVGDGGGGGGDDGDGADDAGFASFGPLLGTLDHAHHRAIA